MALMNLVGLLRAVECGPERYFLKTAKSVSETTGSEPAECRQPREQVFRIMALDFTCSTQRSGLLLSVQTFN
jgi:hypothetical protein